MYTNRSSPRRLHAYYMRGNTEAKRTMNRQLTGLNCQTPKTHRKGGTKTTEPTDGCYQNSEYLLILSLYDDDRCTSGLRQLTRQGTASSAPVQFNFNEDNFPEPMDLKEEHPSWTEVERNRRGSGRRCKELARLEPVLAPAAHRASDVLVHGSSFMGVVLVSFMKETIACRHKGHDMEPGTPRVDVELLVVEHR